MGLGNFFKGLIDPRVSAESIITSIKNGYEKATKMYPGEDPHVFLMQAYLARMVTHFQNPHSADRQAIALRETMCFACIPFPANARALGLFFVNLERPDVMKTCPDLREEYDRLIAPAVESQASGRLQELYSRFNPKLAKNMS